MIDNPQPTLANGRFDCPICGKPATSYMLGYDATVRRQVATYNHKERHCKVQVLHG